MFTIKKSEMDKLGFDFGKAVDDFAKALTAHTTEEGTPAPAAPDVRVEQAVFRARCPGRADVFVPNWTIDDDTPPPPPALTLDQKKSAIEEDLRKKAQAAIDAISPPRKQLELQLRVQDAQNTEPDKRTPAQTALLGVFASMNAKAQALNWWLAAQLSALDDQTDATIDAWKPEDMPS